MQLPDVDRAYIPVTKLGGYLLLDTHPVGRAKAAFFRSLGYDQCNSAALERDLLSLAREGAVVEVAVTEHGTKYVVEGEVATQDGGRAWLRTVWIAEPAGPGPRLVTAYPG